MPDKKTIFVTGASRGIGLAVSKCMKAAGHHVVGVARSFSSEATSGHHTQTFHIDFSRLDDLPSRLQAIQKEIPVPDVIVLCAGAGQFGSLEEFSYEQIRDALDLNFTSQAYVLRCFLPAMKQAKRGHVIMLGSESSRQGARMGSLYCAGKFALRGLAQSLRDECARANIHVTLVNPGMVQTGFFDNLDFTHGDAQENYILPDDIARMILALLELKPGTVVDELNLSPLKKVVRSTKKED